ncbi:hypothetical protein GEV33_014610 [Tenebrio molitor]|uniref:Uncharacterized protein n=1 Tax=Tenebrio molitor TaxID=7067 RepID=A0A8J6H586_TENMO|nr:hypothetical protein GEV33_014610 [Tenebrio molitor]
MRSCGNIVFPHLVLYTTSDSYTEDNLEHVINITPVETSRTFWQYQRRGSAPIDLPPSSGERREQLTRHTSLNGKSSRRKKQLRRRSSGGPETVCLPESHSEGWTRVLLRRPENPDALLARRRGSLPIEVLTVGHSGVWRVSPKMFYCLALKIS